MNFCFKKYRIVKKDGESTSNNLIHIRIIIHGLNDCYIHSNGYQSLAI